MPLMTATEARKRSGKTVIEYLEEINRYILEATEDKKHSIILRGDYERWLAGKEPAKDSIEGTVIRELREAGYLVIMHYREYPSDLGIKISWE